MSITTDQPTLPATMPAPIEIARDTFVIQATQGAAPAVHLNAMLILGREPIIVDTGVPGLREHYLDGFFSLVDPEDVRWVFLSHDDVDHYGNLDAVMAMCPNATLLTSWFQWERLGNLPAIAPHRMRWITDGDTFEANGRTFVAVRPPLYDSPTTRGLLDTGTGVYWASDCFATMVPHALPDVADMPEADWVGGCYVQAQQLSPWMELTDPSAFHASIDRLARYDISTIASCHSPTIGRDQVGRAFEMLHEARTLPPIAVPGQELLDQIIAAAEADRGLVPA